MPRVYLNGEFMDQTHACVPVMDRGFLFGDAVYEVIPAYGGHLLQLGAHLSRLEASLAAIRMQNPLTHDAWRQVLETLLAESPGQDQLLYLQVTRGVMPRRQHAIPNDIPPTVFAQSSPLPPVPPALLKKGISAVVLDDIRWARCDIKATTLLANILLKEEARRQGADEAILRRDGRITEGAACNVFAVLGDEIVTPPKGRDLLPGITRDLVLELVCDAGLPCREAPIAADRLAGAEEIWITSSSREVLPVTQLDHAPVGSGEPGPLWQQVRAGFERRVDRLRRGEETP